MAKFKNVSSLGALEIPVLGRVVEAGEVFDVPDDLSHFFATGNFEAVAIPKPRAAQKPKDSAGAKDAQPPAGEDNDAPPTGEGETPDGDNEQKEDGE